MHHAFLYISLPSLHDYGMKLPNFTFYGGRKQVTMNNFSFLILHLSGVPKSSTPGKFTNIWQFQRVGINTTRFEKRRIHFRSDVFTAIAVVDAKAPYYLL